MTTETTDADLLPCPFCGRQPKVTSRAAAQGESDRTWSGMLWFIACMCGGYSARAHQYGPTEAEAIAAWNTRAALAQRAGEGESWECPECRCKTYARVDQRSTDDGHTKFVPGPYVRCVNCKREWYLPENPAPAADAVEEALNVLLGWQPGCRADDAAVINRDLTRGEWRERFTAALSALLSGWRPIDSAPEQRFYLGNDYMFKVGGRWHGWMFKRHPDGQFVSFRKCEVLPDGEGDHPIAAALPASPKEPNR
jgi:Lar family restriction alleviation protein